MRFVNVEPKSFTGWCEHQDGNAATDTMFAEVAISSIVSLATDVMKRPVWAMHERKIPAPLPQEVPISFTVEPP